MATLREKLGHQMEERGQVDLLISQLQEQLQQSERSHNTTKKQVCVVASEEVAGALNICVLGVEKTCAGLLTC